MSRYSVVGVAVFITSTLLLDASAHAQTLAGRWHLDRSKSELSATMRSAAGFDQSLTVDVADAAVVIVTRTQGIICERILGFVLPPDIYPAGYCPQGRAFPELEPQAPREFVRTQRLLANGSPTPFPRLGDTGPLDGGVRTATLLADGRALDVVEDIPSDFLTITHHWTTSLDGEGLTIESLQRVAVDRVQQVMRVVRVFARQH